MPTLFVLMLLAQGADPAYETLTRAFDALRCAIAIMTALSSRSGKLCNSLQDAPIYARTLPTRF
ncbi:MAG: hypothetical protein QOJ99_3500 [Bryobacterales bacterium]|jgi:hypothetical protein|nr:hypothetical protein [Bryobacterales bacterium]